MSELDDLLDLSNWELQDFPMHYTMHYVCRANFPEPDIAGQELSALKARIAELEAEREWQPIESAPVDEKVLVCGSGQDANYVGWAILMSDDDYWHEEDGFSLDACDFPTRWKHLPEPPKEDVR